MRDFIDIAPAFGKEMIVVDGVVDDGDALGFEVEDGDTGAYSCSVSAGDGSGRC